MIEHDTPILYYLAELRRRLLWCVGVVAVLFCVLSYISNDLYYELALPLMRYLPTGSSMIATAVTATLFAPLKLTAFLALLLCAPFILYQIAAFVRPALYRTERKLMWRLVCASIGLFYMGVSFAYWIVFPLMFKFLIALTPKGVILFPDISQYLTMACQMLLAFGIVFEVPLVIVFVVIAGIISREALVVQRPYVIVGAFILGMLLTPPDVVSQTLLALPLWGLFEVGLVITRFLPPSTQ